MLSQSELVSILNAIEEVISSVHESAAHEGRWKDCTQKECATIREQTVRLRSLLPHLPETPLDAELDVALRQFGIKLRVNQETLNRELAEIAYDNLDTLLKQEKGK